MLKISHSNDNSKTVAGLQVVDLLGTPTTESAVRDNRSLTRKKRIGSSRGCLLPPQTKC